MNNRIIFFLLFSGLAVSAFAAGTTSAVVDLNPIACDAGIDMVSYADSEGLGALVYNPASACVPGNTIGVSGGLMALDMNFLSIGYTGTPFNKRLGIGGMVKYIGYGSIGGLDDKGVETGNLSPYDISFYGVAAWKINKQFSAGGRVYLLQEKMSAQSTGYGIDAGFGFNSAIGEKTVFSAGLTVLNAYTSLWDITQPIGLGLGLLMDSELSDGYSLEYGIGLKGDTEMVYSAGGGVRFCGKLKLGAAAFDYKIGAGYYYTEPVYLVQGLRAGLVIGLPKNIHLGYDALFNPWGLENRLSISSTL